MPCVCVCRSASWKLLKIEIKKQQQLQHQRLLYEFIAHFMCTSETTGYLETTLFSIFDREREKWGVGVGQVRACKKALRKGSELSRKSTRTIWIKWVKKGKKYIFVSFYVQLFGVITLLFELFFLPLNLFVFPFFRLSMRARIRESAYYDHSFTISAYSNDDDGDDGAKSSMRTHRHTAPWIDRNGCLVDLSKLLYCTN